MKFSIFIFLNLILTNFMISQHKLDFIEKELTNETKTIIDFAEKMINEKRFIDKIENPFLKLYKSEINNFQNEILNSKLKIDYYINKNVYESKNIHYVIHFFQKSNDSDGLEINKQFSKIYFLFDLDYEKNKIYKLSKIKFENNEIIQKMIDEWEDQMGNIPPPPLPPSQKHD
jgi:hypothetical protein